MILSDLIRRAAAAYMRVGPDLRDTVRSGTGDIRAMRIVEAAQDDIVDCGEMFLTKSFM